MLGNQKGRSQLRKGPWEGNKWLESWPLHRDTVKSLRTQTRPTRPSPGSQSCPVPTQRTADSRTGGTQNSDNGSLQVETLRPSKTYSPFSKVSQPPSVNPCPKPRFRYISRIYLFIVSDGGGEQDARVEIRGRLPRVRSLIPPHGSRDRSKVLRLGIQPL